MPPPPQRQACQEAVLTLICITSPRSLHIMNSSYSADAYSQPAQFHPATFLQVQPDPTRVYQNPTSIPSNLPQSRPGPPLFQPQEPPRPHSIAELAEHAKHSLGDDTRPFKSWLRIAENARRDAKSFQEQGDLESAFIEFARAATIVLEKIPTHPDYRVLLSSTQRHNMGLVSRLLWLHSPSASPYFFCAVGCLHD
jgi:STAM-binding protein